jgi:two-component system, NtrC family, sensor kinase
MQQSIFPFIFSLLLTQRLIRFSKINDNQHWVKLFTYAKFFSIFLFISGFALSNLFSTQWIWNIFLILCLLFALRQNEMRPLRMFLMAFVPYVAVALINNLTEIIAKDFYKRMNPYFDTAILLSVIWLVAILFSQHRLNKAAEKERLQRQKEDEINRAIAIRKVELEGLVAERTAELTQQKEELEHTLDELRATQAQLIQSEKMASLGELTAGIAHEIQNPLNFVNNFSEINTELISELEEERKKENRDIKNEDEILKDLKENEQKINHHGKRAEAIVKGMLQHSRSSTGKKELTDINALADEYLRLAYHGLRAKDKSFNATMKTDFDETLGKINVIPQDIGRVILNLITNAFYAIAPPPPKGGIKKSPTVSNPTVWLSTKKEGDKVFILVRDNGPGIQKEVLDKIFQPFFTTKPAGQGTGLGLSMSYEIVTKGHGGELKVENNPDGGAKFTVVLPVNKK